MNEYYRDRLSSASFTAWMVLGSIAMTAAIILVGLCFQAHAQVILPARVDMHKIMMIESGGRNVHSNIKSEHAIGIFQITPILLKEYNNFHPTGQFSVEDLWNASVSTQIAEWYLTKRIPQMLRHFKKPVTVENILICYNAGISYVVNGKELPQVTKDYLKKYRR